MTSRRGHDSSGGPVAATVRALPATVPSDRRGGHVPAAAERPIRPAPRGVILAGDRRELLVQRRITG